MKSSRIITFCFMIALINTSFAQTFFYPASSSTTGVPAGKVGIGAGLTTPNANLQIGSGTVDGLLNLGGYAFLGAIRSSGDLFAGQNVTTTGLAGEEYKFRVYQTNAYGFSAMQMKYTGEMNFYSKGGSVTAGDVANTDANLKMRITPGGFVGIGVVNPAYRLESYGDMNLEDNGTNTDLRLRLHQKAAIASYNTQGGTNDILYVNRDWSSAQSYHSDFNYVSIYGGTVGIGTEAACNCKLAVEGSIGAREVRVLASGWWDHVLADDYKLPSLASVESFIKQNRHLPDVPSAEDVARDGVQLGEMSGILLKKIEELTLYLLESKKENEGLRQRIEALEKSK